MQLTSPSYLASPLPFPLPQLTSVFLSLAFGFPVGLPGLILLTIDMVRGRAREGGGGPGPRGGC